jgi:hypothetical protein
MVDILQGYTVGEIFVYALFISMIINAINVCFWEGHIFESIGNYMEDRFPTLWKPVAGCIICMTPWHGAYMILLFGWPVLAVPVAMGINVLIVRWEPKD